MDKLKEQLAKLAQIDEQINAILENDELTEEQIAEHDNLVAGREKVSANVDRLKQQAEREVERSELESSVPQKPAERPAQRKTLPDTPQISNPRLAAEDDPKKGFKNPSEFLCAVMDAGQGKKRDERLGMLYQQAAAGSDEAGAYSDPYGGFLLPVGFSPNLMSVSSEADPAAALTTKIPMEAATIVMPARVDKDHSTSVSGGLRVYRRAETQAVDSSRMELEQINMTAHSLLGLAYATEELLARSPISFVALLEAGFRDEFASKLQDERLSGTGVGMFEGVHKSPALISVPKETGQAANTVLYENVIKMRSRVWRYSQAVWQANHDVLPQLMLMNQAVGTGGVPVWQPSAREDAPDLLLGRPIFFTEAQETLGTVGDIGCYNWSQYLEGTLQPMQSAESIHVRFINHERTFKLWTENDGRCWWRSALTPKKSSQTLSPFVVLSTRS